MTRKNGSSEIWSAQGRPKGGSSTITVGKKGRALNLGEPFVPTVIVKKTGASQLAMDYRLLGIGKEEVAMTFVRSSGGSRSRPGAPKFKIMTQSGEVIHSGSFHYG